MIHVHCPRCQTRFTTSDANLGKTGQCPKCGNPIKVQPAPPPKASAGGQAEDGSATAPSGQETGAPPAEAVADSALGAARRHAAQASAGGGAAEPPAGRPEAARGAPSEPPPEAEEAPPKEQAPAERAAAEPPAAETAAETAALPRGKSKTTALILCLVAGPLGAHRFYMGSWGYGLVIAALNLTCLGSLVFTLIDLIKLAAMDKADFQDRYNERVVEPFTF